MAENPIQELYRKIAEDNARRATRASTRKPPLRFRASEAGYCWRRTYHRLVGDEAAPENAQSTLRLMVGIELHELFQRLCVKHGVKIDGIEVEPDGSIRETYACTKTFDVPMPDGTTETVDVSGRTDGKVTNGDKSVLSFKTMGHYPSQWLQTSYEEGGQEGAMQRLEKKHRSYIWQSQVEMKLFDEPNALLVHMNKGTCSIGVVAKDERDGVHIAEDNNLFNEILQRFAMIKRHVQRKEPPPPEFIDGSQECGYCPFYKHCHGKMKA